jgi:hypothetical protein
MTEVESEAWIAFKSVVTRFHGEQQGPWLRYYCCKYAREIQSLGVLNELKNSLFEFALGFFSRKSWCSEWEARRTFPPGHQANGKKITGSVEC